MVCFHRCVRYDKCFRVRCPGAVWSIASLVPDAPGWAKNQAARSRSCPKS